MKPSHEMSLTMVDATGFPIWIFALGLALLCTPAGAVPCGDGSCEKSQDQDQLEAEASSIQLESTQPGGRSHGDVLPILVDELSPRRLEKRDALPSDLRDDERLHEWRRRIATAPAVPESH
jgi:hypothetical protein